MNVSRIAVICLMVLCVACGRQNPQVPSQRKSSAPQVDSTAMALLELNQQLAQAADQQIAKLAQEQEEPYALYESKAWMHITDRGDENEPAPRHEEEWTVHLRTYTLSGELLSDVEGSYRIGKCELPQAVDANIGELHRGGKARIIAPWYAAYGLQGTDAVPPYENVIIDIELK